MSGLDDINKDEVLSVNKMQELKIIDPSADEHFVRFEGRPIYLIGSCQYDHWISPNVNETCVNDALRLETHRVGGLFKLIRNTEIDQLIEIGQAIMPEIAHTHYLAPSGSTQAAFLRVGNIQFSQAALDAIFFWLLPSLKEIGAIITDTWSIASTALNTSRRLSLYRNENICYPVEMLSYYQAGRNQTVIEALKCIKRCNESVASSNKNNKILFLMSAINTSGLLNSIRESLKAQGQETASITFVTLFNLGDTRTDLRCLRDFSVAAGRGRVASITGSEAKGKSLIQIDPRTYFPARYVDVMHTMRKRDVVSFLRLAKSYANVALFKVHKDDIGSDGSIKHHAVFVDTVALIKTETFRNKLRAVVLELRPRPAVIVTPTHLAGQELAAIAMAVLAETGPRPHHISHPNLHTGSGERPESKGIKEIINKLNPQTQGLLILDDAYISGRRLIAYQTNLRSTEYCGVIHYLIGLARYDDPAVWRRDKSMLEQRMSDLPLSPQLNTVKAIEEVLLPDWDKRQCPWCEELRLYDEISKVREASAFSAYLLLRQKRLQDEVQLGLEDQLFLTNQGVEKLPLHPRSIFQPDIYTEAAFFASVASAMQNHRTSNYPNPLGPRRHPIATVLDHEEYLFKVYTEAFLRACFLRSAQPYEMIYTELTRENSKSRRVEQMLASMLPTDFELGPEILLARAVGKFPNLDMTAEPLLKAAKAFGPTDVFRDMTEGELRDAAAPNKRREGDDEDF